MNEGLGLIIGTLRMHGKKARAWRLVAAALAVPLLLGLPAAAQETPAAGEGPLDVLSRLAGFWELTNQTFVDPAEHPGIAHGRAMVPEAQVDREMILGGTVLRETVSGHPEEDPPYQGLGLTGYDQARGQYWRTWADNQSPGVFVMYGSRDEEDEDVITFRGEFGDPATGEKREVRSVVRLVTLTAQQVEWFEISGDQETRTLEQVYEGGPEEECRGTGVGCTKWSQCCSHKCNVTCGV